MQRLLADIVRNAFADDAVHFDDLNSPSQIRTDADVVPPHHVVIAGLDNPWQDDVVEIKRSHPDLVVLGVRSDGRAIWLYEIVPWPHLLNALGPSELRSTVFAAVHVPTIN